MQAQVVEDVDEIKEKAERSRLEELMAMYESPVRAIVQQLLEGFVEAEFREFMGPRVGRAVVRESDGKAVVDYRNGHRTVGQLMVDTLPLNDFRIPRNRAGGFASSVIERSRRRAGKLAALALELFVNGLGCRRVRRAFEKSAVRISGLSKSSVGRISKDLMQEYLRWSNRPIRDKFKYLQIDAVYIGIRRKTPRKAGGLMFVGIRADGRKETLHFTLGSESEANIDEALQSLLRRGLDAKSVDLVTIDGSAGLLAAVRSVFGAEKIQRCTVHKTRNVLQRAPKVLRAELKAKLGRLWNQSSRVEAEKFLATLLDEYRPTAESAMKCLSADRDALLRFFDFPDAHRRAVRTTNLVERLNREVRRRTKVMDALDTEQGCYGILMGVVREQNERWARKSHWRKDS